MEQSNPKLESVSVEENHPEVFVTDTQQELEHALEQLSLGEGPIAIDAERASGFRYSQRPYLIQIFRRGTGTILLDPPALGDLSVITEEFSEHLWVLHAATQDLPNLREHGMNPKKLFDTELAAKLLGVERFGLQALLEQYLGVTLAKKFSAVDWSTRPLPHDWLIYAALDVEFLIDLQEKLLEDLITQEKRNIAEQEFRALLDWQPRKTNGQEPWRRLSGIHQLKSREQLSIARELWLARDQLAQDTDTAAGRLVPDRSLVAVASVQPKTFPEFMQLKTFQGRASRSEAKRWWAAIQQGVKSKELPDLKPKKSGVPPVKSWERHFPEAKVRLDLIRPNILALAEELNLPHETLLTPEILRNLAFEPPVDYTEESISERLQQLGAREWQIGYTSRTISASLVESLQLPAEDSLSAPVRNSK